MPTAWACPGRVSLPRGGGGGVQVTAVRGRVQHFPAGQILRGTCPPPQPTPPHHVLPKKGVLEAF